MGDMDINTILRSGRHSKLKLYRNFTYWFCKHYFGCDIHPDMAMEDTVRIALELHIMVWDVLLTKMLS